jgi:hypothetical protein
MKYISMRQRLNRSTVGMRHHSAYDTLVQYVHWLTIRIQTTPQVRGRGTRFWDSAIRVRGFWVNFGSREAQRVPRRGSGGRVRQIPNGRRGRFRLPAACSEAFLNR